MGWRRGKMIFLAVCGVTLLVLVPSFPQAETKSVHSKEWLGSYMGSSIPGYEVKKSTIVQVSAWQSVDQMIKSEGKQPLSADLADTCKEGPSFGIGLINIRSIIALGPVPGPRSAPNTYIANGMYREYEADCVTEVIRLSK